MAYGFANVVYKPEDEMADTCPGFFADNQAKGTGLLHVKSNRASTHAGASFILPGHRSPSGEPEALFGFRGTEFSGALQEIANGLETVQALLTVFTDLDIGRKDLTYTGADNVTHDLGYMHRGFYHAVAPFLDELLGNATAFVKGLSDSDRPIINVVGHSLGGALANIFASILRAVVPEARIYLTTFGAPRVGSPTWASLLASHEHTHILRVVAGNDVISLVPTTVGLLDTVIHAGPQLTVGWDGVADRCQSLVEIKNMFHILLRNNNQTNYISCSVSSVSQFHMNYSYSLLPFLESHGTSYDWCNNEGMNF